MDDFLLFAPDVQTLWKWLEGIELGMDLMRLTLHPHEGPRTVVNVFTFWAFAFFPSITDSNAKKGYTISENYEQWQMNICMA